MLLGKSYRFFAEIRHVVTRSKKSSRYTMGDVLRSYTIPK